MSQTSQVPLSQECAKFQSWRLLRGQSGNPASCLSKQNKQTKKTPGKGRWGRAKWPSFLNYPPPHLWATALLSSCTQCLSPDINFTSVTKYLQLSGQSILLHNYYPFVYATLFAQNADISKVPSSYQVVLKGPKIQFTTSSFYNLI